MERTSMRNWSEIYPQLCIFFSEIMEKSQLCDTLQQYRLANET